MPSEQLLKTIAACGSPNAEVAHAAKLDFATAVAVPLNQGTFNGDIWSEVYQSQVFQPGVAIEFPIDPIVPGTESEYAAYTIPGEGKIPERHIEGDYVMVPTYETGDAIDFNTKYLRDCRWDLVRRALQVLEASFTRKFNTDAWRVIVKSGYDRNLQIYDSAATAGVFSKRLVALLQTTMARQAGGNTSSVDRGVLTHLYLSIERAQDMRSWALSEVDDFTRREIFVSPSTGLNEVFGTQMRPINELGVGQEFQDYFIDTLGGSMSGSKLEIVVGLDLSAGHNEFFHPIREAIQLEPDVTLARQRRRGWYAYQESGWTNLRARSVLLGSC